MNKEEFVLILGAGLMQKPSIEAARELGYKTLVVDANPKALCVPYADRFEAVDLKDKEGLAELALSMGSSLKAVFTAGTDFSASVSYVAQKCNLKSHVFEAALNASNKVRMRECFARENVSSPSFRSLELSQIDGFLVSDQAKELKYPVVAKPVDNMGARGCRMIRSSDELEFSLKDAARNSRTGTLILEDYMEGPEFSIDALVYDGTLTITGFADRHIYFPPYFIETGHTMPTVISQSMKNELILCFARGIKSLGLSCGAAKADIKYTEKGPMVGEIAGRLSGGYMSGWTYPYSSGLNLTKQAMLIALGKEPEDLLKNRIQLDFDGAENSPFRLYECISPMVSAERAWISIPGKIKQVYGMEESSLMPFVKNLLPRCKKGDSVVFPRNNVEKCGNVITVSTDYNQAVAAAEKVCSTIVLRLEPCNRETSDFLEGKKTQWEKGFPYPAFEETSELSCIIEEFSKKHPKVESDLCLLDCFSQKELEYMDKITDFNHRTMKQSLLQFEELSPESYSFDSREFFRFLIMGSIQGILYMADCQEEEGR